MSWFILFYNSNANTEERIEADWQACYDLKAFVFKPKGEKNSMARKDLVKCDDETRAQ